MSKAPFLFVICSLLSASVLWGQKRIPEYTASNGITYKVGDEIEFGRGSGENGKFVYVTVTGAMMSLDAESNMLGAAHANTRTTIKKIRHYNTKKQNRVALVVGFGGMSNAEIDIEQAIASCEVTPCSSGSNVEDIAAPQKDKYDKLKDIKALFDDGVLTKEEYESEKQKILDGQ